MIKRGTFQLMKSVNRSIILNKILMDGPISRADIAKKTELTPPTVSTIVKELIEKGIVREGDFGMSKGGRKPKLLTINYEAFYVIGVDAGPVTIKCLLTDLSGKILKRTVRELPTNVTNREFINILKESIGTLVQSIKKIDQLQGIGVAMHGVVDVEKGISKIAPNLNLRDIPIKKELEEEFQLMVKVENDARAMVLGESWFGSHGNPGTMLAVNLGSGIGAGLLVNGKLYHGLFDIAGEIGHMTIDIHGEVCECGNKGCFQTFASGPAIVKRANALAPHLNITSGEEAFQLALEGNKKLQLMFKEVGTIIGIGLTNLIHTVNPELIVLGGGVTKSKKLIFPSILETIEQRVLIPDAKNTEIKISKLGDDATSLGAVALLLEEVFEVV